VKENSVSPNFSQQSSDGAEQRFLAPREVASLLGIEQATLACWRRRGGGPTWYRVQGHLIRYEVGEVLAWMSQQRSDKGGRKAKGTRLTAEGVQ
jgi:predicted DNA-binding transcriptional regulator AlpA